MFTGIIEQMGTIEALEISADGGRVTIHAPSVVAAGLAISNSIAINGCCLTVVSKDGERFSADLSGETVRKTSFGAEGGLKQGARVNLEQPLTAGKEFGGHYVLGHVDGTGRVTKLSAEGESWWYGVEVPEELAKYVVAKGSITIDGISLTVARWAKRVAEIAVIPYTYAQTNIRERKVGDAVNLEGDVLGKYVERYMEARAASQSEAGLRVAELVEEGF